MIFIGFIFMILDIMDFHHLIMDFRWLYDFII